MTSPETNSKPPSLRRSLFSRYTLIAFVAGAATTVGAVALAATAGMHHAMHHLMAVDGALDPAAASDHVEHVLKHLYAEIDATDAQKAQIDPLAKQAMSDLMPLHSQLLTAHSHMTQALEQPTLDRAALESGRAELVQAADQASRRLAQLVADIGDVLTPEQRKGLVEHLQHLHGSAQPGSVH
jgi:Spy/CpxP family protein refolding chaperone